VEHPSFQRPTGMAENGASSTFSIRHV
jgi:hypothetical protein